jgi:hypothetical protein
LKCIECNFEGASLEEVKWHMNKNHMWPECFESSKENETQTTEVEEEKEMEEIFNCKTCKFEAEDNYDLDAHWFSSKCVDSLILCHYCDMNFQTKCDLMTHRKHNNPEKVNVCQHFLGVGCTLPKDTCWYSHQKAISNTATYIRVSHFA